MELSESYCSKRYQNYAGGWSPGTVEDFLRNNHECFLVCNRKLSSNGIFLNDNNDFVVFVLNDSKRTSQDQDGTQFINKCTQTLEDVAISLNGPKIDVFLSDSSENLRKQETRHNNSIFSISNPPIAAGKLIFLNCIVNRLNMKIAFSLVIDQIEIFANSSLPPSD